MTHVFLSASIPDPRRDPVFAETADRTAIREAVISLAAVALKRGRLIFGGHPAISPLVSMVSRSLGYEDRVRIYQSAIFRDVVPAESLAFPDLVWVPQRGDRETSLTAMRARMLDDGPFAAAFFIGGMEGVVAEHEAFTKRWPDVPAFVVASTGGAAALVSERVNVDDRWKQDLRHNLVYGALFERILKSVDA